MDTLAAIRARRTAHRWRPTPVADAVIDQCIEAAHLAPCHKLTWPWRFTRVGPQARARITALGLRLKCGPAAPSDKKRAFLISKLANPALVVVTQVMDADPARAREDYAACACAIQNMLLAATAQGLHGKWSSGGLTTHAETRAILGVPAGEQVVGFVWIGEPLEVPAVARPAVAAHVRRVP